MLCNLRVTSLGWSPGRIEGTVLTSDCVSVIEEAVSLQTVAGHASVTETALMEAEVTGVTGTVTVTISATRRQGPVRPRRRDPILRLRRGGGGRPRVWPSRPTSRLVSTSRFPPLVQLTHHPERVEQITTTVHLLRPGDSDADSETATVSCDDGSTSSATATAYAHVPSVTIAKDVTVDVQHEEHVRAEVVERTPIAGSRGETLHMATSIGSDASFEVLVLPEPTPTPVPAEQTPLAGRGDARPLRHPRVGVAVVRRAATGLLRGGVALASAGAAPAEEREMLEAFNAVLTAMAYAAAGLCLFSIVWAGFVLMAEGGEERGGGRARNAVLSAVAGLVLVLSAKAVALALLNGIVPIP